MDTVIDMATSSSSQSPISSFLPAEQFVLVLLGMNPNVTGPEMAALAGGRNIKNTHRILRTLVIAGRAMVLDGRYSPVAVSKFIQVSFPIN